jgi:hypothetical protein
MANYIGDELDYLDPHDRRAEAHDRAMRAPIVSINDHDPAQDRIDRRWSTAAKLTCILAVAAVAAAAYFAGQLWPVFAAMGKVS